MNLHNVIRLKDTTIVDVRSPQEFRNGHVPNAINIPLDVIEYRIGTLQNLSKPVVLCCASGNRSHQAYQKLREKGCHEIVDGGAWMDVYIHQM